MAIDDLPGPVATFLNVVGAPWPYTDEDDVHRFAALVREFGQAVNKTHRDATETLEGFAQAYQSSATEQMRSGWAELASNYVQPLVEGAGILADALDVGAAFIVAQAAGRRTGKTWNAPFTGTGYTEGAVPEWNAPPGSLPDGAEIWQINADGSESAIGYFDQTARKWKPFS